MTAKAGVGSARRKKQQPETEESGKLLAARQIVGPIEVSGENTAAQTPSMNATQKVKRRRKRNASPKKKESEIPKRQAPRWMIGAIVLFLLAEFALIDLEWSHRLFKLWDPRFFLLPLLFALPYLTCRYCSKALEGYQQNKVNHVLMREVSFIYSLALIPCYFFLFYVCGCSLWHWCRQLGVFLSNIQGAGQ